MLPLLFRPSFLQLLTLGDSMARVDVFARPHSVDDCREKNICRDSFMCVQNLTQTSLLEPAAQEVDLELTTAAPAVRKSHNV